MRKNLPRNTHDKKSWTHEIPARKNFDDTRPAKFSPLRQFYTDKD